MEYNRANPKKMIPFVTTGADVKGNCFWLKCDRTQKNFEGMYKLQLTNAKREESTTTAKLTVKRLEPSFTEDLQPITAKEFCTIKFQCEIDDPNQLVIWSRCGQDGQSHTLDPDNTEPFTITNDQGFHTLKFEAQSFLSGLFSCKMDDSDFSFWDIDSNAMQLTTSGNFNTKFLSSSNTLHFSASVNILYFSQTFRY